MLSLAIPIYHFHQIWTYVFRQNVNPLFSTPIKAGELDSEKESDDPSFILDSTSVSDSASSCDSDTENDFFEPTGYHEGRKMISTTLMNLNS